MAQPYGAEVGEDDGAGAAAVEAVDAEGEVQVLLGGVEIPPGG
ncbi:hypothetical protein ABZX75_02395 [Streptomyces sp. NPDC003038]